MDNLVREDPASGGPMPSGGEEDKQADMDGLGRPRVVGGPYVLGLRFRLRFSATSAKASFRFTV